MYVYLYDNFLNNRKYNSILKQIEVRLVEFGIAGKILRLNNYIDAKPIIDDEIKRGAKNIIIVGNDRTFGHILSRGATCDCVFGFLPIGPDNDIADVLGIPEGIDAADVLARRRKQKLDVGWFNNRFFVSQLHVPPAKVRVIYDEKFQVSTPFKMEVVVCNFQPFYWKRSNKDKEEFVVHPQDDKLEAFLRPLTKTGWFGYKYEDPSIFPFEEMEVIGEDGPFVVEADGKSTKEVKVKIRLAKDKIDMIVGRDRKF
ncbi:MAG: diacylglycerol kinase family protein [Patescibacteria group bacterium]